MTWEWVIFGVIILFGFVVFRGAPYVPSRRRYIRQAFTELYPLASSDVLVDIGSGDGVVLRQASQLGARAIGYELNPALVLISKLLSLHDKRVSTYLSDFWLTKLPTDITVFYGFTVTRDIKKMTNRIQSEANKVGRPISLILYGNEIAGKVPLKIVAAYKLYEFIPISV